MIDFRSDSHSFSECLCTCKARLTCYIELFSSVINPVPVGNNINSCIASLFPAWLPPLMTLKAGTGMITSLCPAKSAMCLQSETDFSAAPALHTAMETPKIAFAPSFAWKKKRKSVLLRSPRFGPMSIKALLSIYIGHINQVTSRVCRIYRHLSARMAFIIAKALNWSRCEVKNLHLLGVPSSSSINSSIFCCSATLKFLRDKKKN